MSHILLLKCCRKLFGFLLHSAGEISTFQLLQSSSDFNVLQYNCDFLITVQFCKTLHITLINITKQRKDITKSRSYSACESDFHSYVTYVTAYNTSNMHTYQLLGNVEDNGGSVYHFFLLVHPVSDCPQFIVNKLNLIKQLYQFYATSFLYQNQAYCYDRFALSFADCFISFSSKAWTSHFSCACTSG